MHSESSVIIHLRVQKTGTYGSPELKKFTVVMYFTYAGGSVSFSDRRDIVAFPQKMFTNREIHMRTLKVPGKNEGFRPFRLLDNFIQLQ